MTSSSRLLLLLVFLSSSLFIITEAQNDCDKLPSQRARRFCRENMSSRDRSQTGDITTTTASTTTTTADPFDDLEFDDDFSMEDEEEVDRQDLNEISDLEKVDDLQKFGLLDSQLEQLLDDQKNNKRKGPEIFIEKVKSNFYDEDLVDCNTLPELNRKPNVNCREVKKPVIRWRDPVFERLLPQVWRDYQKRMRFDRQLYGTVIDPLSIGNFAHRTSNFFTDMTLSLHDIQVHGLSTIYLVETLVTRPQDLSDLNMKMAFRFDELYVNGTYTSQGSAGWQSLDSNGEQNFEIKLSNATVSPTVLVNSTDENRFGCGEGGGSVNLDVLLPMEWQSLNINFENIGSVVNSLLNIAATALINTQGENLASLVKAQIKKEVNSLICTPEP